MFQPRAAISQNLVPNPGFEIIDSCSFGSGAIVDTVAPPWDSPSAGSVDLYNTCSTHFAYSVPENSWGFQYPHTGNGYAGGGFYSNGGVPGYREYLQVELDSPLVANQNYCGSFYVNLTNLAKYANNNFGMYFSTTHIFVSNYNPLNLIPQINDTTIVSDTANWILVYGKYRAQGGERYIIIGNFYTDAQTDTVHFNANGTAAGSGYYFIDDVNIHCCTCDSVNSHEGVSDVGITNEELGIMPNPATDKLTIELQKYKGQKTIIEIRDLLGQLLYTEIINTSSVTIDVSQYPNGVYFVQAQTAQEIMRKKFVKE